MLMRNATVQQRGMHGITSTPAAAHRQPMLMQDEGCQPNVVTYNTLIDVYGKMGRWEDAVQVLDDMADKVRSQLRGVLVVEKTSVC